jgi:hypothetical protein
MKIGQNLTEREAMEWVGKKFQKYLTPKVLRFEYFYIFSEKTYM